MRTDDSPQASLYEAVGAIAFTVHPYRRPVIGWMSDIENFSRDALKAHYDKYYSPRNALIVAVGDIEPTKLMEQIDSTFGKIENPSAPIVRERFTEPVQKGERRVLLKRKAELPYMIAVWHTPVLPDADSYALDVLSEVLGGGKSGRLYRALVYDKKLAQDVSVDYQGLSRDPSLFSVDATASVGADPAELERSIYAEIDRLKSEPQAEFEIQKARNSIEASFVKQQDSIYAKTQTVAQFELMGGGWRERDSYIGNIRRVTAEDVRRVAAKYLIDDHRTAGVLVPAEEAGDNAPSPAQGGTGGAIR